ncbi:MAG TPA: flagella basal body P-ring formation protein FlgA [Rhodothermales bacterium]|nr:flagella basal body P-ring formation protein FlgA [Rhodothermales bacterium]
MRSSPALLIVIIASVLGSARPARAQANGAEAMIRQAAETYLHGHYPADAERLEVRVQRISPGLPALNRVEVRFPSEGALPRAATYVTLYASNQKVGWAMIYVARFDSVVVSHVRKAADEEIGPHDVTVAWMETTRSYGEPLRAADFRAELAAGPVYARSLIRDGDVLLASDVRPAYAADTGAPVLVTYARRGVVLRLDCTAREPGSVGDVIRVYSPATEATYQARLTSPGTADWISTL